MKYRLVRDFHRGHDLAAVSGRYVRFFGTGVVETDEDINSWVGSMVEVVEEETAQEERWIMKAVLDSTIGEMIPIVEIPVEEKVEIPVENVVESVQEVKVEDKPEMPKLVAKIPLKEALAGQGHKRKYRRGMDL